MASKNLHTVISDIIESKRYEGTISTYTDNGDGTFTYYSPNTLIVPCYITINEQSVPVVSADSASFTLKIETTETTWKENKPYFMHEKEIKAFQILTEKTKQDTFKYQKYPLVLLYHPFTRRDSNFGAYECDFRLAIINYTNQNWYSDDRYENNFDAVLNPILDDIIDGMCENNNIAVANKRKIEREFVDSLYISGNPLPDELDAIVVDFKNIVIVNDRCQVSEEADTFDVTTEIVGDGEINTNPTTLTGIKKNTIVSLNATTNEGSRFGSWVVNGITYLNRLISFYMTGATTAIATFIKQWTLTVTQPDNGTITASQPEGLLDEGKVVDLTVIPNEGYEVDSVSDGDELLTEPYQTTMTGNKSISAVISALFTYLQNALSTTPVQDGDNLIFADQSENGNDLIVTDSYWWKSTSAMSVYPSAQYDVGTITEFTLLISCYVDDVLTNTSLLSGFGLGVIPNANGTTIDFNGSGDLVRQYISGLSENYLNKPIRIAFTVKSGGVQRCYINGVKIGEVAANTFSKSGMQTFAFGSRVGRADAKFWNYQVWNKELSESDILYDYEHPYDTAFNNPEFAIEYTNKKDVLLLWWRMATGYQFATSIASAEYDASGNGRNSFGMVTNDDTVGWVADNPCYHANAYYGITEVKSTGITFYRPFDADRKPTLLYSNDPQGEYRKHKYPLGFIECESKIYQKNTGLPDYNNFWYDAGGVANKKSFSDFTDFILNNQLFFDISEKFHIGRSLISSIETLSTLPRDIVNNDKILSRNVFIFGDSMPGGMASTYNILMRNKSVFDSFAKISNVGGQHSYQSVDGWFDDGSTGRLPLDIKTRYPENPNGLWTDFDNENNGTVLDYLTEFTWESDYYQIIWFGTNNPDNTYTGTYDYGEMHYRLIPDLQLAYDLNTNTDKIGCIIMHGNLASPNYATAEAAYRAKATELDYDYIDPKSFFSEIYKKLKVNDTDHPVIQKLIELDTQEQYIKVIDGKVYIWNDYAAKTDSSGNPLDSEGSIIGQGDKQGTIAKWVNLGESTPNTLVTIDSIEYDVFNPNLLSGSITGYPFILDYEGTWPSSLHRDNIHPNIFATALLIAQISIFRDNLT